MYATEYTWTASATQQTMSPTTADSPSTCSPTRIGTDPVSTSVRVPVRSPGSRHATNATTAERTSDTATGAQAVSAGPFRSGEPPEPPRTRVRDGPNSIPANAARNG